MPVKRHAEWADLLAFWLAAMGFAMGILLLALCGCGTI